MLLLIWLGINCYALCFPLHGSASMACDLLVCYLVWIGLYGLSSLVMAWPLWRAFIGIGLYIVNTPLRIVWLGEPGCSLLFYRPLVDWVGGSLLAHPSSCHCPARGWPPDRLSINCRRAYGWVERCSCPDGRSSLPF